MSYSTHNFVTQGNKTSKGLILFPSRDDETPPKKSDNDKIMDILESASPKDWHDKMRHQRFSFSAKRQPKLINFCDNLEILDPTKAKR
eukprot:12290946-Ditylum_brightwellii.AAC.1